MSCLYICDGCHKQAAAQQSIGPFGGWSKPRGWYAYTDRDAKKIYDACSRLCIARLEKEKGVCGLVSPLG